MTNTEPTTILIIDHEELVRQRFADHLEDLGYRILTAKNGCIGVALFDHESPDLVLVNLHMPEMDGLEVLAHVTRTRPNTPLIVVSGTGVIREAIEALHQGAWDYILRPMEDFSILTHVVGNALEKARLKRENRQYRRHLEQMVAERTQDLKEKEDQLRVIFKTAMDGFIIGDYEGRILNVNDTYCNMSGYSRQELLSMRATDLEVAETKAQREAHVKRIFEKENFRFETRHRRKDGTLFDVEVSVQNRGHEGRHIVAFVRDISDRKKMEKRIRQAQKMEAMGTLAGGIAHDFNNILGVIFGCTELALMHSPENSRGSQHMRQVLKAAHRATDLVQQILVFTRRREMGKQPLRLSLVLKEVSKMLRATLPATIEIRQEIDRNSGMTLADPAQIHQILMNLGTNAAHAMQDTGGVLQLKLKNVQLDGDEVHMLGDPGPGSYLKLTVGDTGHGMDRATLARIFEPYFTTKNPNEGTGLGLAVVMGIVKGYGGAISVQSEPGKGSRFHLFLPKTDDADEPDQPRSPTTRRPLGKERILVVDDEVQLANTLGGMLRSLGYRVQVESESIQALRRFREDPEQFDLVISDMTMPNITGDVLARELMQIRVDIPIILCTGFSRRIKESQVESMGIRELMKKPICIEDLAAAVGKALHGRTD
jgi:PAS domain S-box-containing protein